jgi:hypothetical protein
MCTMMDAAFVALKISIVIVKTTSGGVAVSETVHCLMTILSMRYIEEHVTEVTIERQK